MALDGWTKVGDHVEETGYWVVYRHKGTLNATLEALGNEPSEQANRAWRRYTTRARTIGRGGLWLVDPTGTVRAVTFIRQ